MTFTHKVSESAGNKHMCIEVRETGLNLKLHLLAVSTCFLIYKWGLSTSKKCCLN